MAERGTVGRLLNAFANAVLERTLPSVRKWLASKAGPDASVRDMQVDGSRIHLLEARLPLGPTAVLEIDRATFVARVSDATPLYLESLEGRLVVPREDGGDPRFSAPLRVDGEPGPTGKEWVHGALTVTDARWLASAGRDAQAPMSGTATVSLTSSEWSLVDGSATAGEAAIGVAGRGRIDDPGRGLERAVLDAQNARAGHFADALFALAGRDNPLNVPLPWTGRCDGRVVVDATRVTAELEVRTEGSTLAIDAVVDDGVVERARVDGTLQWSDLLPASIAGGFEGSAPVSCAGDLSGALAALDGTLALGCATVALSGLRADGEVKATLTLAGGDAHLHAAVTLEHGGALEVRGAMDAERALDGTVTGYLSPSALDLEALPVAHPPPRLSPAPGGGASGDDLQIRGTIAGTLGEPRVVLTAETARVELPPLVVEGLRATVAYGDARTVELRGRLGSGTFTVDALASTLSAARVDAASTVALARVAGIEWLRLGSEPESLALFALPDDTELDAELAWSAGIEGAVHARTPRSDVAIDPLRVDPDDLRWDGSVVRGRLAAADALTCGLFPGPFRPTPEGHATLELPMHGAGVDTFVDGRITTASLAWRFFDGAPPVTLSAAASGLRVDGDAVTLTGLEGRVFGGTLDLDVRIAYPVGDEGMRTPTGRLVLEGARDGFGPWLRELSGLPRLPTGLALDVELASDDAGRLRGPVVLSNPRSRLTLALSLGPFGALDGSVLGGELSLSDLYELIPRGGPTLVGKGSLELQAELEGDVTDPKATVSLSSEQPKLMVAWGKGVRVAIDRAVARGRLSPDRLVWSQLTVDAYGGRLRSQGLIGWGAGFRGVQAKLELDEVRLGAVPLPGGGRLGEYLAGRLHGSVTLKRPHGEALAGRGQLWVEDPVYPALGLVEAPLSRYGLKPPPIHGTEPLLCDVRGGARAWMLKGISGTVRGARVDGDVAIEGGALLGALDIALEAAYLRTSAILRVPATMVGDVKVPVRLRGPLAQPDVEADLLGALDHLVSKSRVGRGIHRAVDRVMDGVLGSDGRRHAVADDAERLDDEALIRRIARGIGDEERYLDVLIERGLDPADIADRIEAARRR